MFLIESVKGSYQSLTNNCSLKTSQLHVLAVMKQQILGRPVLKITGKKGKRNSSLYCDFIEMLVMRLRIVTTLKKKSKSLIKQVYLTQFFEDDTHRRHWEDCRDGRRREWQDDQKDRRIPDRSKDRKDDHPSQGGPGLAEVINTISGALTRGDSQNFPKRTYQQTQPDLVELSFRLDHVLSYGPMHLEFMKPW